MPRRRRRKRQLRSKSLKRRESQTPKVVTGFKIKRRRQIGLSDVRLQHGLTLLRDGKSVQSAAKAARTSPKNFKRAALRKKAIEKRGNRWVVSRDLHREMLIYSEGKQISVKFRTGSARHAGKYMSAVGAFLRSNNIRILDEFIDRGVKDIAGKRHVFETNPNTLYRLTSSTDEAFEQIYRIVLD